MNTYDVDHKFRAYVRKEAIVSFFINFVITVGLAYWTFRHHEELVAWGEKGYFLDLTATGFFMASIVAAIFIIKHKKPALRWVLPVPVHPTEHVAEWLPPGVWLASFYMGLLGLISALGVMMIVYAISLQVQLSALAYALLKAGWVGFLAMIVVPIAIRCGLKLREAQPAN